MGTQSRAIVYVFAKDNEIMVLDTINARALHAHLIEGGWKHTHTIDACLFIEKLYNDRDKIDLIKEMEILSNTL